MAYGVYRQNKGIPVKDIRGPVYYDDVPEMFGIDKNLLGTWLFTGDRVNLKPMPMADGYDYIEEQLVWSYESLLRWGMRTGRLDEDGRAVGHKKKPPVAAA